MGQSCWKVREFSTRVPLCWWLLSASPQAGWRLGLKQVGGRRQSALRSWASPLPSSFIFLYYLYLLILWVVDASQSTTRSVLVVKATGLRQIPINNTILCVHYLEGLTMIFMDVYVSNCLIREGEINRVWNQSRGEY